MSGAAVCSAVNVDPISKYGDKNLKAAAQKIPVLPPNGSVNRAGVSVLNGEMYPSQLEFVRGALKGVASVCAISEEALIKVTSVTGAEMGVLIVPYDDALPLKESIKRIKKLREVGSHLFVLGLTWDSSAASLFSLEEPFDTMICLGWVSAAEMLRRTVQSQRNCMQNRAFRAFLDHSVDGYWIWHIQSDYIEWSSRTCEMLQIDQSYAPRDMAGFVSLVHAQDRDRVEQAIRNHFRHSAPYKNIEMMLQKGDGRHGHFVANGQALRDEHGAPIIFVGSLTDRSLMQLVERQLEDTQRRFTVLFHHMNDAAVLADVETGVILEANQPAERLWGRSIAELVGSHQTALHPPKLSSTARKAFADHISALMKNKRDTINVPILHKDGSEVPAEISSSLIELDGRLTILGVFRDISERVRAERELRERDAQIQLSSHLASMGTLAAGVAHEINNPLTYLLGNLQLLKAELEQMGVDRPAVKDAIYAAETGGHYVKEIVSDLKAISRIDSANDSCDPCDVLRIASRMAMSDLRHRAKLDLRLAQVPKVGISSARLSQVVLNILSNSARAFESCDRKRNHIEAKVEQHGTSVRITITDNGIGIAPDDLKRVWEPFFTKKSKQGGTGLGLAISRRILHEVGGRLDIWSVEREGTTVVIEVPVLASPDAVESDHPHDWVPSVSARPRILVLDDEPLVTTLVSKMLERDYEVLSYNDPFRAARALMLEPRFDLILCDIMMPEMDGRTFFARFHDKADFLFMTGGAVTEENLRFEQEMVAKGRVIHKPFDLATLIARVASAVAKKGEGIEQERGTDAPARGDAERLNLGNLAELEAVLGKDYLRTQFHLLMEQLDAFLADAGGCDASMLAASSHRLAGAADAVGFVAAGKILRACQNELMATERVEAVVPLLEELRQARKWFAQFMADY